MERAPNDATPLAPPSPADRGRVEAALRRVHRFAFWLDDAFEIPVIRRRVGLDPIIGLIPGAGDWVMWLASVFILIEAARLEVPVAMLFRMGANIALDLIVGAVPVVGDLADAALKANRKNARLLLDHFGARGDGMAVRFEGDPLARPRSSALGRWAAAVTLVTLLLALLALPLVLIAWLAGRL